MEIKASVPVVQVLGSNGDTEPIDINRDAWRRMVDDSMDGGNVGNEMAQGHVARVVSCLENFWKDIGRMFTCLGVVEDELLRETVH